MPARGARIKLVRKAAGGFIGGELLAGEVGIDPVNSRLVFSIDGATVTILYADLAQMILAPGPGTLAGTDLFLFTDGTYAYYASFNDLATLFNLTFQAYSLDLSIIAGLTPANNDFLQKKVAGWTNRTPTQVKADLGITYDYKVQIKRSLGSTIQAETFEVERITSTQLAADGLVLFQAIWLPTAATITGVKWYQATQGVYTGDNNSKVGLYTYSGGTLTRVAQSTDDTALWKVAAAAFGTKAFSGTYSATGGLYFVAGLCNMSATTTTPAIGALPSGSTGVGTLDYTNSGKSTCFITGQNDLPSSQAMSGLTAATNPYWFALY